MQNYLFTSNRLGFRNWKKSDVDTLHEINSNEEVMRYFPKTQNKEQTLDFIHRMQKQFNDKKLCYFAVEIIDTKELIGFIGLSEQTYAADFNPSIDIGWRLHPKFWGKGYATEGAKRCIEYGFSQLNLKEIISVAPIINIPSITVMEKIKMKKVKEFQHPLLTSFPKIEACVLYRINN